MYIFFSFNHNKTGGKKIMKKIPKMISTKDMAYITDIFNWNITAAKKIESYINNCNDEDLVKEFQKTSKIHLKNCDEMISLLEEFDTNE